MIISVCPVYNGADYLNRHIASLNEHSIEKYIFVDNDSKDNSIAIIKRYSKTIIIPQKTNQGFAKACNIGIRKAIDLGADKILLLNQDVYLKKNSVKQMLDFANKFSYAIYSPMHYSINGTLDKAFQYYIKDRDRNNSSFEVPFVNAASWLIPIDTIKTIGLFDPLFQFTGEDLDYCNRIEYFNKKIAVIENAGIIHDRNEGKELFKVQHSLFTASTEADYIHRLKNINQSYFIGLISSIKRAIRLSYLNNMSLKPWYIFFAKIFDKNIKLHRKRSILKGAFYTQ